MSVLLFVMQSACYYKEEIESMISVDGGVVCQLRFEAPSLRSEVDQNLAGCGRPYYSQVLVLR